MPSTIPQSRAIWEEEVVPRFLGVPGFQIKQSEKQVCGPNGGIMEIISAEAALTAQGRKFDGIYFDEPRDYPILDLWRNVFRPTLIDLQGWAMFGSATRVGSQFNELCKRVAAGKMPGKWREFHWRTQDNPKLPPEEFAELLEEYADNEVARQQELEALLLDGLAGLAFPEFVREASKGIHVVPTRMPPRHWQYVGFLDWGYQKGCYGLAAVGPEGQLEVVFERILKHEHAAQAAENCLLESRSWPLPQMIAYDVAMDYDAGVKQGTTLRDEWIRGMLNACGGRLERLPAMLPAKHTPGSRPARKNLLHRMFRYQDTRNPATGLIEPWALPKLRFQQQCRYLIDTFATIPLDEKRPDDVDTHVDDHGYDAVGYLAVVQPGATLEDRPHDLPEGVHPGLDPLTGGRKERPAPWELALRRTNADTRDYDTMNPGFWTQGG